MFLGLLHVVIGGGVVAFVGGVVAQVDPNGHGNAGYVAAIMGFLTALGAAAASIGKAWIDYKEKQQQEETLRYRITYGNDRSRRYSVETRQYLEKLAHYISTIPGAPPGIPPPPVGPEPLPHHNHVFKIHDLSEPDETGDD